MAAYNWTLVVIGWAKILIRESDLRVPDWGVLGSSHNFEFVGPLLEGHILDSYLQYLLKLRHNAKALFSILFPGCLYQDQLLIKSINSCFLSPICKLLCQLHQLFCLLHKLLINLHPVIDLLSEYFILEHDIFAVSYGHQLEEEVLHVASVLCVQDWGQLVDCLELAAAYLV